MTLLEKCLDALGQYELITNKQDVDQLFDRMTEKFPPTSWGRLDWTLVQDKAENLQKLAFSDLLELLRRKHRDIERKVYILWGEGQLPAVKVNLQNFFDHFYEASIVCCDVWIFCPEEKYVIEFYHEGETTIGFF